MPKIVPIKDGYTPTQLRHLAATSKDANQSRRLLSIAAALDGMSRAEAAKIGGMDRQTLRDWVHRFNERRLVLEPDLDGSVADYAAEMRRENAGEVFLKAAMVSPSCFGCLGRPLTCEKPKCFKSLPIVRS